MMQRIDCDVVGRLIIFGSVQVAAVGQLRTSRHHGLADHALGTRRIAMILSFVGKAVLEVRRGGRVFNDAFQCKAR